MEIEFDTKKNQRNIKLRGIDFSLAVEFDYDNALEVVQVVNGETRYFLCAWPYWLAASCAGVHAARRCRQGHQPAQGQQSREATL